MNKNHGKLWELSDEIVELESLLDKIQDCEDLTESEKEVRLNHVFSEWLNNDSIFNEKAEKGASVY